MSSRSTICLRAASLAKRSLKTTYSASHSRLLRDCIGSSSCTAFIVKSFELQSRRRQLDRHDMSVCSVYSREECVDMRMYY